MQNYSKNKRGEFFQPFSKIPHEKSAQGSAKNMNQLRGNHPLEYELHGGIPAHVAYVELDFVQSVYNRLKAAHSKSEKQDAAEKEPESNIFSRDKALERTFYRLLDKSVEKKRAKKKRNECISPEKGKLDRPILYE